MVLLVYHGTAPVRSVVSFLVIGEVVVVVVVVVVSTVCILIMKTEWVLPGSPAQPVGTPCK